MSDAVDAARAVADKYSTKIDQLDPETEGDKAAKYAHKWEACIKVIEKIRDTKQKSSKESDNQ